MQHNSVSRPKNAPWGGRQELPSSGLPDHTFTAQSWTATPTEERRGGSVRWSDTGSPAESPANGVHGSPSSNLGQAGARSHTSKPSKEYAALLEQAGKSAQDNAGRYRCLGCGRMCGDLASFCQHLKDRHGGVNSASAPGSVNAGGGVSSRPPAKLSLADFLRSGASQRGARVTPARDLMLTERQLRNVRGFVKAYPNKQDLAKEIKGRLRAASGKKKWSRLKRLILREKTDKAVETAAANVATAVAAAKKAEAAHASVSQSLQDAKLKLEGDDGGEARLPANLVTEVQVLEMALAEAERRVANTSRKAVDEEEAAVKARADQDKAWRRGLPDAEVATQTREDPRAEQEGQPGEAPPAQLNGDHSPVFRLHGSPGKAETSNSVAKDAPAAPALADVIEEGESSEPDTDDGCDDDMEGLQGFEDVLATWLHDANQKTLALGGTPDSPHTGGGVAQAGLEQAEDEDSNAGSQTDSDGLGPDGWDDVLSAWMSNAGILARQQEPSADEATDDKMGNGNPVQDMAANPPTAMAAAPPLAPPPTAMSAAPPLAPARVATPAQRPGRRTIDVETPVRQSSAFDHLISPKPPSGTNLSPRSTIPTSPEAASYGSVLLGAGSDASFNLSQDASLGSRSWLGAPPPTRETTSGSLRTGGSLLSGQLSPENIMDLRAYAENAFQSDEEVASARVNIATRTNSFPNAFQSRHSDIGTASLMMGSQSQGSSGGLGSGNMRQASSWGPWAGSTNINAGRWSDSGTSLPRLQSADPAAFRGHQDAIFEEARAGLQGQRMSLLERTASVGAMPDLGLPRSHTAAGSLQNSKLFGSALSMGQRQMHLADSSPLQPQLSGLNNAFGSLASMSGSALTEATQHGGHSSGWISAGDLRLSEAGHGGSGQQNGYLNNQQGSPHPDVLHHRLHSQLQPILSSQWEQPSHGPLEPSPFQGNPNGGPMLFQDGQGLGDPHFMQQEQPPFPFATNLSHQQLLLEQARLSQNMGLDMQSGMFPDSFHMAPPQHTNLPHYHSYPGPQSTLQGMPGMNTGVDSLSNMFALRNLLSEGGGPLPMFGDHHLGQRVSGLPDWNGGHRVQGVVNHPPTHDFHCTTCNVSCCGLMNYQQHCNSKRHLRKTAAAGAAILSDAGSPPNGGDEGETSPTLNPTYVGLQAQCRNYCKQVISTDLNRVVVDLLQQLLFWQDRSKAMNAHNAARKKRLVSGLREVAKAIRLGKARTIIVTPNIEKIEAEGGLDDLLTSILENAEQTQCPIVFALSRKKLGQIFGCRKKMSAIAILDYAGAEELFKEMEQLAQEGRREWEAYRSEGKTPPTADDVEASAEDTLVEDPSRSSESPSGLHDGDNAIANTLHRPTDLLGSSFSPGLG